MSCVTQADRDCRNAIYKELTGLTTPQPEASQYDWMDKYLAAHRIAAEKASVVALATAYQCGYDTAEERTEKAVLDRLRIMVEGLSVNQDWVGSHISKTGVIALIAALETKQ